MDVNIEAGGAGLEEDHPIELEDDEPEAGPLRVGHQGNVKVERTGSESPAGNAVSEIADEIAEAQVCWQIFAKASRHSSSTLPLANTRTPQGAQASRGSWARRQQGEHHPASRQETQDGKGEGQRFCGPNS